MAKDRKHPEAHTYVNKTRLCEQQGTSHKPATSKVNLGRTSFNSECYTEEILLGDL